jgi:hypothetical protein|tara:strand:- start:3893 stop:4045 length:153 start_codon:yes stop_codon:yes gene_type:complete
MGSLEIQGEMEYGVAFIDPKFGLKGKKIIQKEPSNTGIGRLGRVFKGSSN